MANRKRDQAMYFMVTPRERQLIAEKMAQLGTKNTGAYLRKMAVDGYIRGCERGSEHYQRRKRGGAAPWQRSVIMKLPSG